MNLTCYRVHDDAPELIPARATRPWMDATASRFADAITAKLQSRADTEP